MLTRELVNRSPVKPSGIWLIGFLFFTCDGCSDVHVNTMRVSARSAAKCTQVLGIGDFENE